MAGPLDHRPRWMKGTSAMLAVVALVGLILVSRTNYLLFHALTELFGVAVAAGIFMLAWNARRYMASDTLLLLGIASLFVALLDLLHTLAYGGMGVFPAYGADLATQLWIAARWMHSLSLLAGALLLGNRSDRLLRHPWALGGVIATYVLLTALALWAIFGGHFPTCYVDGVGLTPFKRASEAVISLVFALSGVVLWRRRAFMERPVLVMLLASIGAMVVTELVFTLYLEIYSTSNALGHLFKVAAFYELYRAIIRTGLMQPYAFVSRDLRESEARFRSYITYAPHGVLITDAMGRCVDVNPAASVITGYPAEELRSMSVSDLLPAESHPALAKRFRTLLDEGWLSAEAAFLRKDGSVGTWLVDAVRLSPTRMIGFVRDITPQRRAEDVLRESESRFRQLYENMSIGLVQVSLAFRIEAANQAYCDMLGYREAELRGMHLRDITHPDVLEHNLHRQQLLSEGAIDHYRMEMPFIHHLGHTVYGLLDANLIRDGAGAPKYVLASVVDIGERKEMEQERERLLTQIQEQVQRIEGILNSVPEGVLLIDAGGCVMLANPAALRDLGTLAGVQVGERLGHLGNRALAELLTFPTKGLRHEVRADGRVFEVISRPVSTGPEHEQYVIVISDVTRERQVQAELQHQERLAAIGQLAAGIAHDFNNILAVIVLYAQMDLGRHDLPEAYRGHLAIIEEQAGQASDLVQQILDFGRRSILDPHPLDLDAFLQDQVRLLSRTLPESVKLEYDRPPGAIIVDADPRRLRQVLMNLVLNSRDAMPAGGTLTLSVEWFAAGLEDTLPDDGLEPGDWAKLTVRDTGTGISDRVRPHLFEPFYTTKPPGKGTGLGLPQVYGIVKQHGGHIEVVSQEGEGTTVIIHLPATRRLEPETATAESPLLLGDGETILLVEDNVTLREAMVGTLNLLNYRVVAVGNGEEALAVLVDGDGRSGANGGARAPIAMVLSDLVMPQMGGQALFYAMKARGLSVPLVIITGHPMERELRALEAQGVAGWLMKPLQVESLAQMLGQALRGEGASEYATPVRGGGR